jgi:hypothetical protein
MGHGNESINVVKYYLFEKFIVVKISNANITSV